MHIEFDNLIIENFGSFIEVQSFNLKSLAIGIHFICGDNQVDKQLGANGSGKSTLINALCWGLYGKTSNGLKSSDIRPWHVKGIPTVSIVARFDGKRQQITRIAPNKLELNGKEVGQEEIDRLLHMSFAVFKQTILFGQQEALFFDLPNKTKLELLSDVLELDRWEIRSQKAAERTRELEKRVNALTMMLDTLGNSHNRVRELIEIALNASSQWEAEQAKRLQITKEDKQKLTTELGKISIKLATTTRIAKVTAERLGEAQANMIIAKNNLDEIEKLNTKVGEQDRLLKKQMDELECELQEIQGVRICPTCKQPITIKDLTVHKRHMQLKIENLQDTIKNLKWPSSQTIAKYKQDLITAKSGTITHQAQTDSHRREMEQHSRKLVEVTTRLDILKKQTTEKQIEINPHATQLEKLREQSRVLRTEQKIATEDRDKANRRAIRSKYWIKGFKDVRLFIINDVLQELEMVTNTLLQDMGLIHWQVHYAVERETLTGSIQTGMVVSILSPRNKKPVKWESWSGGEGQRLRLAGALALSEVLLGHAAISTDLEILDEPTKHLSDEGVRDMCEMLATRAEQLERRILYIDHQAIDNSLFVSTITVVKTTKGSHLLVPH